MRIPKLGIFSARELCRILQDHGFAKVRQSGSHIILQKPITGGTRTVPVPNHSEISVGTLKSIIEQSGLEGRLFRR